MGQRVLQPIINQQVGNVLTALEEGFDGVEVGVGDLFGGVEGAAAGEDAEGAEDALFVGVEEVVRPVDGGAEGVLAWVGVAGAW